MLKNLNRRIRISHAEAAGTSLRNRDRTPAKDYGQNRAAHHPCRHRRSCSLPCGPPSPRSASGAHRASPAASRRCSRPSSGSSPTSSTPSASAPSPRRRRFSSSTKMVDDRLVPGTLNIGHALPTIAQALIYIAIVQVDFTTLVLLIAAAVAGAWLGAGIVSGCSRRAVQLGMGMALLRRRRLHARQPAAAAAGRRRGAGAGRREARHRPGDQLHARRADDARHRPLRALHDHGQPARHETRRRRSRS